MAKGLEPMNSVDTAWLHMDRGENHMMITGVLVLDRPLDLNLFKTLLENRLLRFDRFRQRVVERDDQAYWQDDPYFSLDNHLHRIGLPGPAGQAELQELVADLASEPLDFHHPLWQFQLVDRYQNGAALITRIHHCIADGLALVQVLMSLADEAVTPDTLVHCPPPEDSLLARVSRPLRQAVEAGTHLGHNVISEGMELARHPQKIRQWARDAEQIARELACTHP